MKPAAKEGLFLARSAAVFDLSVRETERLFRVERRQSLRINTLSPVAPERIAAALHGLTELRRIAWAAGSYVIEGDKTKIARSEWFTDGHVMIQNASSLLPVLALDPRPGQAILDAAAAPGVKTSHIAALVANRAQLWVNDIDRRRLATLESLLKTYEAEVATVSSYPAQYLDKFVDARFDRILLDMQCSGEGMIDLRDPHSIQYWNLARVRSYSRLQQRSLVSAFRLLRPGGLMVYATCTAAPEENEAPVSHLLTHFPEAELEPVEIADSLPCSRPGLTRWQGERMHPSLTLARRIVPTRDLEAFFVARIRRKPSV